MVRRGPTYHSLMDRGTWTSRSRSALRQWAITVSAAFVVLLSVGTALGAMTEADVPGWAEGLVYGYGLLCLAAGVWCVRLIHTRDRDIRRSTLLLGVLQTALPVGPVMGFALPRFIRTQPEREAATASGLYGASLILVLWRDMLGQTTGTSMVRTFAGGEADQAVTVGPLSLITVYLLTLLIPIGIGLYQRSKERLAGAEEELAATGQTAADMSTRLSRKEEREMIAREIHDRIGHRLSLVALYAGGLEMTGEDAEVNGRLRQVRRSAQEAIDDLQDLIRIMRDPASGEFVPESHSLADLAEVIEGVLGAGHQVSSTVMIDDPASAPELLTSAAFRIVQELLTNSIKHAPDSPVRVRVVGGPGEGLSITVVNGIEHNAEASSRAGGLVGVQERAEALGGWTEVARDAGEFRVRAWMPWGSDSAR